jgi:hypothetical protein
MYDWLSLSHVRWECNYHVVIMSKYRQKVRCVKFRRRIGTILRDLHSAFCVLLGKAEKHTRRRAPGRKTNRPKSCTFICSIPENRTSNPTMLTPTPALPKVHPAPVDSENRR